MILSIHCWGGLIGVWGKVFSLKYKKLASSEIIALSGVTQGPVWDLYYLMYSRALCQTFNEVEFSLFVDDLKLYQSIVSDSDVEVLQDRSVVFSKRSGHQLNLAKCRTITFSKARCNDWGLLGGLIGICAGFRESYICCWLSRSLCMWFPVFRSSRFSTNFWNVLFQKWDFWNHLWTVTYSLSEICHFNRCEF